MHIHFFISQNIGTVQFTARTLLVCLFSHSYLLICVDMKLQPTSKEYRDIWGNHNFGFPEFI